MNEDRLREIVKNFGGFYAGSGVSQVLDRQSLKQRTEVKAPREPRQNPFQKAVTVGKQGFDINKTIAEKTAGFVKNTAVDVAQNAFKTASVLPELASRAISTKLLNNVTIDLNNKRRAATAAYEAGTIDLKTYEETIKGITEGLALNGQRIRNLELPDNFTADRSLAVADTAFNILSLGSYVPLKALGKKGASTLFTEGLLGKAITQFDDIITKVPAVNALVARNSASFAKVMAGETVSQSITRNSRQIVVGLLIKRPLFYQQNIGGGMKIYDSIMEGDYPSALKESAWLSTQMLRGGPIGAFFAGSKWIGKKVRTLSYGTGSYIDDMSKQIGNKNPNQVARFLSTLKDKAPEEYKKALKTFGILQEVNLKASGDEVSVAVRNTLDHYVQHGYKLENITPSQLYKDMSNWSDAFEKANKLLKSGTIAGVSPSDAHKYVVVRWDNIAKNGLADALKATDGSPQAMLEVVNAMAERPGIAWGNNEILLKRIREIAARSRNADEASKSIKAITTASVALKGMPAKAGKEISDLGFVIARPAKGVRAPFVDYADTRKLVTAFQNADSEVFDIATAPQPTMKMIAKGLEKMGLSPVAANRAAQDKLSEGLVAGLDELDLAKKFAISGNQSISGGRAILSSLQNYIETLRPVFKIGRSAAITDVRQLRIGEIATVLKLDDKDAKLVSGALMDAYVKVPMEFRGLGDKVVDYVYRINPGQKYYSRIQSAFRYTYNLFFRTQESTESFILSGIQGGNRLSVLANSGFRWNVARQVSDDAVKLLNESKFFSSSFSGEAAQDLVFGRITANITNGQKRDLAGLAMRIAKTKGVTLEKMLSDFPDEIEDALRVVVQYQRGGILSSPLARTLNIAFFPMRYNLKVTNLAAQVLAKQPPSIQMAAINGLFTMKEWLKSDEGINWQSTHADAIQVFKWLTPINSIEYTMNLLQGHTDGMGGVGLIGGLPLGFITQMLDSQGIINLNKPYVNPKTGDVLPDWIPISLQGRASVAMTDLLGTMFTFPGRTLGLPGKGASMREAVKIFIDTNGEDFEKRLDTKNLTELQKRWIKVLKGDFSEEALDALYNAPAEGQFDWYTLPPFELPLQPRITVPKRTPILTKSQVRTPSGRKKKKIALPIPPR